MTALLPAHGGSGAAAADAQGHGASTAIRVTPHPHGVRLRHTFQTDHRLPQLAGQCRNLHGHGWKVAVTLTAPQLTRHRTVVEFGAFKTGLRGWIDAHLDHGAMLGAADPAAAALAGIGSRVFRFGADDHVGATPAELLAADQPWPTVEAVAVLLARVADQVLAHVEHARGARIGLVEVEETDINAAWYAPTYPAPRPGDVLPGTSGGVGG